MPEPIKIPTSMPLSTPEPMNITMPKARKRFIVSGNVQLAGYRIWVKAFARNLGISGFARNLPDNTVEIVCEGEPSTLKLFLERINKKGDPVNPMVINVDSINESPPPPEGDLTMFEINYDGELSPKEREKNSVEREERMILGASILSEKIDGVGQKVDGLGQKMDCVGQKVDGVGQKVENVGTAVRDMHKDMNTRFDHMAKHYDMIAMSLREAIDHMDRNAEKTDKAIEKSRKETILEVQKSQKEIAKILAVNHKETTAELTKARKDFTASNRELAKAVNFMIKKLSDRPISRKTSGKTKR